MKADEADLPTPAPDPDGPAPGVRQLFQARDFRLLWSSRIISEFGDSLTALALLILINRLTGSTVALALMTIVLLVPQIVFGLLAGVYVDRLDRRRIMIVSDLARGAVVLGFTLVTSAEQIWILYLLGLVQASVGTFFNPAQNALLPLIVPRRGLLAANSIMATSQIVSLSLGGAVAGLLISLTGLVWPVFVIDALTFFISVGLVSRLRFKAAPASPTPGRSRAVLPELAAGLKITVTNNILLGTLTAAGVALLGLGAVNVLFIPMLVNELHSPESWMGPIQIAGTAATILSGSLVAALAGRFQPTTLIWVGLAVMAVTIAVEGAATAAWQMVFFQFVIGAVVAPINTSILTLNQSAVSDAVRGRVAAARMTITSVSQVLSMALAGVLAEVIGVRNMFMAAGGFVALAALLSGLIFRAAGTRRSSGAGTPSPASPADEAG